MGLVSRPGNAIAIAKHEQRALSDFCLEVLWRIGQVAGSARDGAPRRYADRALLFTPAGLSCGLLNQSHTGFEVAGEEKRPASQGFQKH
jgi:hypothetical protein